MDVFNVTLQGPLFEPLREWLRSRGLDMANITASLGDEDSEMESYVVVIPPGSPIAEALGWE
jgi:hypothetical protein